MDKQLEEKISKITIAISTAIVVISAAIIIFVFCMLNTSSYEKVGGELAQRHLLEKTLLVESHSIETIAEKLSELDFQIINSSKISDYSIVGANYSLLNGKKIAKLKLKSSAGEYLSLFQFKQSDIKKLEISTSEIKGVLINIWTEGDLYFVLAK